MLYIIHTDLHSQLQHSLTGWLIQQSKLVLNTKAGTSDFVFSVDAKRGIVYNLSLFNEGYLNRYYSGDKFMLNAERMIRGIAKVVEETAVLAKQEAFKIDVTIKLDQRSCSRCLRFEDRKVWVSV